MDAFSPVLHTLASGPLSGLLAAGQWMLPRWAGIGFEILFFFVMFLMLFRIMQSKGIVLLVLLGSFLLTEFARTQELERMQEVLNMLLGTGLIALVVIFHPELRRGLLRFGETGIMRFFIGSYVNPVDEVIKAALHMSKNKVGALAQIAERLAAAGINMEYAYCTAAVPDSAGALILRTNDLEGTINALS